MRKRLTDNLGLKVLALIFAALLWLIVVNIDDPVLTKTFTGIEVEILNSEVVTNKGKSLRKAQETQTVSVTVKATRSVLQEMHADDIKAYADMKELMLSTQVPISVEIPEYEGEYEEAYSIPGNLQVVIEDDTTNTFPITPSAKGNPQDGYVVGEIEVNPEKIKIGGPKSIIERISRVEAEVDITGISEDTELPSSLVFYDTDGRIVDTTLLTFYDFKKDDTVNVTVKVQRTKSVPVKFDDSNLRPADGYIVKEVVTEPKEVLITGEQKALASITELNIPASALQMSGLERKQEEVVDITPYLPQGIDLVGENAGSIVVTVMVEEIGTRTIEISSGSISVNNLQDGLKYSYLNSEDLAIKLTGDREILEQVELNSESVLINLVSYKEPGEYDVPVEVKLPEGCSLAESVTVKVLLEKK